MRVTRSERLRGLAFVAAAALAFMLAAACPAGAAEWPSCSRIVFPTAIGR
jgi:hypothetical protein